MKLKSLFFGFSLILVFFPNSGASELFPVMGLTEVRFEGGSARATKEAGTPWTAEKAFLLGHANAWHNSREILPSTVWYEFPVGQRFAPARVSFRPRQDCCLNEAPNMWQFVGSNDEACHRFGNWTVLCQDLSGSGYRHNAWTKHCDVDEKITTEFRCLGIAVLNTDDKGSIASLKDVRMWKKGFH